MLLQSKTQEGGGIQKNTGAVESEVGSEAEGTEAVTAVEFEQEASDGAGDSDDSIFNYIDLGDGFIKFQVPRGYLHSKFYIENMLS